MDDCRRGSFVGWGAGMRKWLIWLLAGFVLAGLADGLIWLWATSALAAGVDRWTAQLRAQGWTVETGSRAEGGWPLAAIVTINDIRVAGGEHMLPGGLDWHTGSVTLAVSFAAPLVLSVTPEGHEWLRLSHVTPVVFDADRIQALVPLWGVDRAQAELVADLMADRMTGGLDGSHHPQDVRLESLLLHVHTQTGARGVEAKIDLAARGIELPDIGRWPLGATVSAASAKVDLVSPRLPDGAQAPADQARAWRDLGGSLALTEVKLRWGPLVLQGGVKLGLDDRLQPAGSGTATVSGGQAALDALVDGGVVLPGVGATAKAVLGAMAPAAGGDSVRLPFVLHDSTFSVGPIPLLRVNDILW